MIVTVLLRFILGVILASGLTVWVGLPFPADLLFPLTVGIIAAMWGDKFLLRFMSVMRYLR